MPLYAEGPEHRLLGCADPECAAGLTLIYTNNPYLPWECVGQVPEHPGMARFAGTGIWV